MLSGKKVAYVWENLVEKGLYKVLEAVYAALDG
jgi:hypothetical protein